MFVILKFVLFHTRLSMFVILKFVIFHTRLSKFVSLKFRISIFGFLVFGIRSGQVEAVGFRNPIRLAIFLCFFERACLFYRWFIRDWQLSIK